MVAWVLSPVPFGCQVPDVSPGPGTRRPAPNPKGERTLDQIGPLLTLDRLFQLLDLFRWFVFSTSFGRLRRLGWLDLDWWGRLWGRHLRLGWTGGLYFACTCGLAGGPGFR